MNNIYTQRQAFIFSVQVAANGGRGITLVHTLTLTPRAHIFIDWIVASYGFLLHDRGEYTPAEFAAKIRAAYDASEPHTAKALECLAGLEELKN
jgi:hypothetical protein